MSWALDVLVLATGYTHVLLAPYTKVEESFNLHAVHDVLMYGVFPSSLHNVRTTIRELYNSTQYSYVYQV